MKARVFISSIMSGFGDVRQAAIRAIEKAGCNPIYAEQFRSAKTSPRTACLDAVASCDGIVLILGARYGDLTESGLSATEEEYREAVKNSLNIYVFLEKGEYEPKQAEFISQIEDYVSGHWRKTFSSTEELANLVNESLTENLPMISAENEEIQASQKIDQLLAERPVQTQGIVWLRLVLVSLRDEVVIDPIQFAESDFQRNLQKIAHESNPPLLQYSQASEIHSQADRIQLDQGNLTDWRGERDYVQVVVKTDGSLSLTLNVTGLEARQDFGASYFLDPGSLITRIKQAWNFCSSWWAYLDPYHRHNPMMFNAALYDVGARKLEKLPETVTSISIPGEIPFNPLIVFDEATKISRNDLGQPHEITRIAKMVELRFKEIR